jgi:hypothetical protein
MILHDWTAINCPAKPINDWQEVQARQLTVQVQTALEAVVKLLHVTGRLRTQVPASADRK